jgi:S1-C subfamily serine protease
VIEQSPVAALPTSATNGLTPQQIYLRDAPGVVFVSAQAPQQVENPFDLSPQQPSSLSTGSGFLIDRSGHVLTNYHVISGANRQDGVTVRFADDFNRRAQVIGEDESDDLALLKVDMHGLGGVAPLPLGDSATVRVGDATLAIGDPFGLDRTLTTGIVSALQRQLTAPNGFTIYNVIQTDAPINPGNSGGPLLDALGRVIGINSQIAAGNGSGSEGIGFAVPINTAKDLLGRLERGGDVVLAYLGINGVPTPGAAAGVLIDRVIPGSPAALAGLRRGQVLLAAAGRPVASMGDVQSIVDTRLPGETIPVRLHESGHPRTVKVVLGSRSSEAPGP